MFELQGLFQVLPLVCMLCCLLDRNSTITLETKSNEYAASNQNVI